MDILTRGDLDGLTSSLLLTLVEKPIGQILFAHPKDVQDGKVKVTKDTIVLNLPFVPGCGLWFDHHASEEESAAKAGKFKGRFAVAPSCARVIYDHYKDPAFDKFKTMLEETDRLDSANLKPEDVSDPKAWILLGYTLDPRTGLGPEFRRYFRWLVEYVKEVPIEKVLNHMEVKKRCHRVEREREQFTELLKQHAKADGTVIVTDFRTLKAGANPVGNRFLVYTLFPEANVEARILRGHLGQTINVAIGKSIFNRTLKVNIGKLCHDYGGGGHEGAGTCQFKPEEADAKIAEVIAKLKA